MSLISKNVLIDKLDDIGNKCNSTCHVKIKMKPVDVKWSTYIEFNKEIIRKVLNSKLVIMQEYQNTKIFLQKTMFQISLKKFLWLKKLKILFHGHMLVILMEKEIVGTFYEKKLQKNSKRV